MIDNALIHGDADAQIIVRRNGRQIDIENSGPVLEAVELQRMRKRFVRGEAKSGGAGLGLAIVYAIVEGGGVEVSLTSLRPGRDDGMQARVILKGG